MKGKLKQFIKPIVLGTYAILVPVQAGYRFIAYSIARRIVLGFLTRCRQAVRRGPGAVPATKAADATYHPLYPAENFLLGRPANLTDSDWQAYRIRDNKRLAESFVLDMRNASVNTKDGWVRDSAGKMISDIWSEMGYETETMASARPGPHAAPNMKLSGTSACLTMPWLPNYYHWTLQLVPRFHLVSKAINPAEVDHWILPAKLPPYVVQWLDILGIPEAKRVQAIPGKIACERLIAASIPAPNRCVPAWALDYIRSRALPEIRDRSTPRIFYIARNPKDKRRILNRPEFYRIVQEHDIPMVELDGKSVREQIELFNGADLIISLHGAALANIVYCKPGARLIEILPKNLTFPCYYKMSQALGIRHDISIGLEPRVPFPFYEPSPDADVIVNLDEIREFLKR